MYSLWSRFCDWSNMSKVACKISCWRFHTEVKQLIEVKLRHIFRIYYAMLSIASIFKLLKSKIISTSLVMLVALRCGFQVSQVERKKIYRTMLLCTIHYLDYNENVLWNKLWKWVKMDTLQHKCKKSLDRWNQL